MFRRSLPLFLILFLYAPSLLALTYSDRGSTDRSQFVHRRPVNIERTDPRMKYLKSRKTNSCTWGNGVCTTNGKTTTDGSQTIRFQYQNTKLNEELARQKKLRPWL